MSEPKVRPVWYPKWYWIVGNTLCWGYLAVALICLFAFKNTTLGGFLVALWFLTAITMSLSGNSPTVLGRISNVAIGTIIMSLTAWANSPLWKTEPDWLCFVPFYAWVLMYVILPLFRRPVPLPAAP